jgi:hypothetical protein
VSSFFRRVEGIKIQKKLWDEPLKLLNNHVPLDQLDQLLYFKRKRFTNCKSMKFKYLRAFHYADFLNIIARLKALSVVCQIRFCAHISPQILPSSACIRHPPSTCIGPTYRQATLMGDHELSGYSTEQFNLR